MYRRSLTLLWAGTGTFTALAITTTTTGYADTTPELFGIAAATCIVCACILHATSAVTTKLLANQATSDDVHTRIEQLSDRVATIEGDVGVVRDLTEVNALDAVKKATERQANPQPELPEPARIYQFPIHADGRDIIAGTYSSDQPNTDAILAVLDGNDPGMTGRHSAS